MVSAGRRPKNWAADQEILRDSIEPGACAAAKDSGCLQNMQKAGMRMETRTRFLHIFAR